MFQCCEFTFAGVPSGMYGLEIYDIGGRSGGDVPFGNKAKVIETRVANRIEPLHYGVRYHDEPLSFKIVFGSHHELDRFQLQEISYWLTGYQSYQWMTFCQPDMEHLRFKCIIRNLTPISVGWANYAFEADVVCDCPYAHGYPYSKSVTYSSEVGESNTDESGEYIFKDMGSTRELVAPDTIDITIQGGTAGGTTATITNCTTGDEMMFANIPSGGVHFIVHQNTGVIETDSTSGVVYDPYSSFNFQFIRFKHGDNVLRFSQKGTYVFNGSFLYNVGA